MLLPKEPVKIENKEWLPIVDNEPDCNGKAAYSTTKNMNTRKITATKDPTPGRTSSIPPFMSFQLLRIDMSITA